MDFELKRDSAEFKVNQAKNEAFNAQIDTAAPLAKSLGDAADKASILAQEFPKLTSAVTGAYSAFQGMSAMQGAGLGGLVALGGKKVWNRIKGGKVPDAGGVGEVAEDVAKTGSKWLKPLRVLSPVGDVAMAGEEIYSHYLRRGEDRVKDINDAGYSVKGKSNGLELHPVGFLDALDEIKNFFSQSNTAKPAPAGANVPYGPQGPQQPVVANIYLDSREVSEAVLRRIDVDSRRK